MSRAKIWNSMGLKGSKSVQNYDTRFFAQHGLFRRPGFGEIWCGRDNWWHQHQDSKTQPHEFGQLEFPEGTQQGWDTASLEWVFRDGHPPYDVSPNGFYQGHLPMEEESSKTYPGLNDSRFTGKFLHVRDRILVMGSEGVELLEIINDVDVERYVTLYLCGMTNSAGEIRRNGDNAIQVVERDNHGEIKYSVTLSEHIGRFGFTHKYEQWDRIRRKAQGKFPKQNECLISKSGRIFYVLEIPLIFPPKGTVRITTAVRYVDLLDGPAMPDYTPVIQPETMFEQNRRDWEKFYDKEIPIINCNIKAYEREMNYLFTVNRLNANESRGLFKGKYICCFKYLRGVVPTDSAGGATAAGWMRNSLAEEAICSIFDAQFKNGFISQVAVANGAHLFENGFQHIHNPAEVVPYPNAARSNAPIMGMMAYDIYRRRGNAEFAHRITEPLQRWVDWWFTPERDPDRDGLCDFIGRMESSLDDTIRTKKGRVTAIELNTYLYGTLRQLAEFWKLQDEEKKSADCNIRADKLKEKINQYCWNEDDGFFYDLIEGRQTGLKTSAAFQVLATDIPDIAQVRALVKHLLNPEEFWTYVPASGISKDALPDDPNNYPSWDYDNMFNMTWFTLIGLWRKGYQNVAAKITWRLLRLTQWSNEPSTPTTFNGRTGLPYSVPAHTFSGLIADFFMRYIAGIHPDSIAGKVGIAPWLGEIERLTIDNLPYSGGSFSVKMLKTRQGMTVVVSNNSSDPMRLCVAPTWCDRIHAGQDGPELHKDTALQSGERIEFFLAGKDDKLLYDEWHTPWS